MCKCFRVRSVRLITVRSVRSQSDHRQTAEAKGHGLNHTGFHKEGSELQIIPRDITVTRAGLLAWRKITLPDWPWSMLPVSFLDSASHTLNLPGSGV